MGTVFCVVWCVLNHSRPETVELSVIHVFGQRFGSIVAAFNFCKNGRNIHNSYFIGVLWHTDRFSQKDFTLLTDQNQSILTLYYQGNVYFIFQS
jgi:hypothetical protein